MAGRAYGQLALVATPPFMFAATWAIDAGTRYHDASLAGPLPPGNPITFDPALLNEPAAAEKHFLLVSLLPVVLAIVCVALLAAWAREREVAGHAHRRTAAALQGLWGLWMTSTVLMFVVQLSEDDPYAGMPGRADWLRSVHLAGVVVALISFGVLLPHVWRARPRGAAGWRGLRDGPRLRRLGVVVGANVGLVFATGILAFREASEYRDVISDSSIVPTAGRPGLERLLHDVARDARRMFLLRSVVVLGAAALVALAWLLVCRELRRAESARRWQPHAWAALAVWGAWLLAVLVLLVWSADTPTPWRLDALRTAYLVGCVLAIALGAGAEVFSRPVAPDEPAT